MGPPFDHTYFNPYGHYLYVAMNEHEVNILLLPLIAYSLCQTNDTARIVSPQLTAAGVGCHVRMFYHLHGIHLGKLNLLKR